nr:MAG TPA: hypothetical protein [Caudoviricetes sp.]
MKPFDLRGKERMAAAVRTRQEKRTASDPRASGSRV